MRALALLMVVVAGTSGARVVAANGVRVVAPENWHHVRSASDAPVVDPRTLLVVGTAGVVSRQSQCQVAAYRIPPAGAAVVILGWRDGAHGIRPGRAPLRQLRKVTRPVLECFAGRGAATTVVLGGKAYGVYVMVRNRAGPRRVEAALRVARSFDLVR
jgi:hypothetical protein